MSDFSLTTMFVVPVGQTTLPNSGSTQDLTAGHLGLFSNAYAVTSTPGDFPYFYIAQGRENTYLQGSKRSDKIKGCTQTALKCNSNVTEWYKVSGCGTPINQITQIGTWNVKCGDILTLTLRAHSSYLDTLYFNGLTRSVTVQAPCCDCGADPCDNVDVDVLIDLIMEKLTGYNVTSGVIDWTSPIATVPANAINPDNWSLNTYFTFSKVGSGDSAILQIEGKALTVYGQPCDVAAFPHEYDRMWFRAFVYEGPATTADFIVSDSCNIVAVAANVQLSTYATGTAAEIKQMEKNYYSYQAGYQKHLYRMAGYNGNFESYVTDGVIYDTYYIKFNDLDKSAYNWGDYIPEDAMVIIAVPNSDVSGIGAALETALEDALGAVSDNNTCLTTTSTSTTSTTTTEAPSTTSTTTTTTEAPSTTTTTTTTVG
jgi:hypothetical protein